MKSTTTSTLLVKPNFNPWYKADCINVLLRCLLICIALGSLARGADLTGDYFPMHKGDWWLYEGTALGITEDIRVEIDRTLGINGRTSFGHYKYIVDPDAQDLADDRFREYYSLGSSGLHLDRTVVELDFGDDYTIDLFGRNLIGISLQPGAVKSLDGPVLLSLAHLTWFGEGTGTARVEGMENVTVPGGTFSTYRIRIRLNHSLTIDEPHPDAPNSITGSDDTTIWVARNVGVVKQSKTSTSSAFGTQSSSMSLKAFQIARSISGVVRRGSPDGVALPGVTLRLTSDGTLVASRTADANGHYRFEVISDGDYTITPELDGYEFEPAYQTAAVSGDLELVPFVGEPEPGSLSGFVREGTDAGAPLAGVELSAFAGEALVGSTTTDASGRFSFHGLASGEYTVVPVVGDYTFNPPSQTVLVSGDVELPVFVAVSVIIQLPDLLSGDSNGFSPAELEPGDLLTVVGQIHNAGAVAAENFQVKFLLSNDSNPDEGDVFLGTKGFSGVGASAVINLSEEFSVPIGIVPGEYHVCWLLDSANAIHESDENNNVSATAIRVVVNPLAQINVLSPGGEAALKTGSLVAINWTSIGDIGGQIKLDLLRGGVVLGPISSGTANDEHFEWHIPAWALVGTSYQIRACSISRADVCDMSDTLFSISQTGLSVDAIDTDGDGMPDLWEDDNLLNKKDPSDALLDWDGDGFVSIDEFQTGTDPEDPNSHYALVVHSETGSGGNDLSVSWRSAPGFEYSISRATSVDDLWAELPGSTMIATGIDTTVELTRDPNLEMEIFRVTGASQGMAATIVRQPVSRTADLGETVSFLAVIKGAPHSRIQWERLLPGESTWSAVRNDGLHVGETTPKLVVNANALSMSGSMYRCVVGLPSGSTISDEVSLTVAQDAGDIVVVPEIWQVLKLGNLKLDSTAMTADQTIQGWFEITNTSHRRVAPPAGVWIGVQQKWIERLGDDNYIPRPSAARDGDRYAAGGGVFGSSKDGGDTWEFPFAFGAPREQFEAGHYRLYVDFNTYDSGFQQERLQHAVVEFEIVTGANPH